MVPPTIQMSERSSSSVNGLSFTGLCQNLKKKKNAKGSQESIMSM